MAVTSPKTAPRVVGYARYSTDKQTQNSIAYQKEAILNYCRQHSIALTGFYVDEATTGTNLERDGLRRLMDDAEAGLIDTVIIYDVSRGSRDVADWFYFRKSMIMLGVEVVSINNQLGDWTNPTEFFQELIQVGVGQFEVLQTRQRSMAGTAAKAKEGVFLGGIPPLGYDIVDRRYVINEQEAEWVRVIFDMYAHGKSYNEILDKLKEMGARGKRGRPLGKNSLRSILTNERYIGVYFWNKRRMKVMGKWAGGKPNPNVVRKEGVIPPIIDQATWDMALERRTSARNGANKAKRREYLLSGLIECELCGAAFVGKTSTNSKGYESSSYVCGNKHRTRTCTAKNINARELETFVVNGIKEYLRSVDFAEVAQKIADDVNKASPNLLKERTELAEIERKLQNGVKAVLSGIHFPELQEEMDRLRVRKSELEDIIARAQTAKRNVKAEDIVRLFEQCLDALENADIKRVVRYLVTKIYAHADGSCTVNVGVNLRGCGGPQPLICATWKYRTA